MCEQMFKQSPEYFQQFHKDFRYFVTDKYPEFSEDESYGFSFHSAISKHCTIKYKKHWHVLSYKSVKALKNPNYQVFCPLMCFVHNIVAGANFHFNGEMFEKLQFAMQFNERTFHEESIFSHSTKLPNPVLNIDVSTQTDLLTSTSIERYLKIINSPYGGDLSAIIDSFASGYGSFISQTDSTIVSFSMGLEETYDEREERTYGLATVDQSQQQPNAGS